MVVINIRTTLSDDGLAAYVAGQLNHFFFDGRKVTSDAIHALLPRCKERLQHCFSHIHNKYFFDGQAVVFNHLHGDQYAMFLYLLCNTAFRMNAPDDLPSKLFLLNKALHGCDIFYEVELPDIFLLVHPLGTVLGRAKYDDFLIVYQRVGVGSNHDVYPKLGKHVTLRPGSSVLGNSLVGDYCSIAAESLLLDDNLPDHHVYIGNPRDRKLRPQEGPQPIWRI
jgi:serine O-acetyltransferase